MLLEAFIDPFVDNRLALVITSTFASSPEIRTVTFEYEPDRTLSIISPLGFSDKDSRRILHT
jgi:hypothetical protein